MTTPKSLSRTEVWKDVPSAGGIQASSWGRVRLPPYTAPMHNGGVRSYEVKPTYGSRVIQPMRMTVVIRRKTYKVHRLVCEAFHGPPPTPKHGVLHDDENGWNNEPSNLSWGTQKENLNAPGFKAYCKRRLGDNSPTSKSRRKAELEAWD